MSEMLIRKATLTGIADAVRAKEGTSAAIPVTALAQRITALPSGTQLPTLSNPAGANDVRLGKDYIDQDGLQSWGMLNMDEVLTPDWSERIPVSVQYDSDDRYLVMDRLPTASGGSAETVSVTIYIYGGGSNVISYGTAGASIVSSVSGELTITVIKGSPVTIAYTGSTYLQLRGGSGYSVLLDSIQFGQYSGSCHVLTFSESGSATFEEA